LLGGGRREIWFWGPNVEGEGGGGIENVKTAKYFSIENNWKSFCSSHIFSDFSFACKTIIGG
jgi:hypothetical protein